MCQQCDLVRDVDNALANGVRGMINDAAHNKFLASLPTDETQRQAILDSARQNVIFQDGKTFVEVEGMVGLFSAIGLSLTEFGEIYGPVMINETLDMILGTAEYLRRNPQGDPQAETLPGL